MQAFVQKTPNTAPTLTYLFCVGFGEDKMGEYEINRMVSLKGQPFGMLFGFEFVLILHFFSLELNE